MCEAWLATAPKTDRATPNTERVFEHTWLTERNHEVKCKGLSSKVYRQDSGEYFLKTRKQTH